MAEGHTSLGYRCNVDDRKPVLASGIKNSATTTLLPAGRAISRSLRPSCAVLRGRKCKNGVALSKKNRQFRRKGACSSWRRQFAQSESGANGHLSGSQKPLAI